MKILAIETSCDETGISILECSGGKTKPKFKVLANELASQIDIHKEYGGVFPALAKREHIKNLPILLEKALKKAKLHKAEKPVDAIAVTYGPGLEPALWTGIVFAKKLAKEWDTLLIPVNHMEGHILSVFAKDKGEFVLPKVKFPVLSLLVSGGHTELVLSNEWMKYKLMGATLDDALGEAFDKVARMLELPYPGGPEISKLAEQARKGKLESKISLPRPMIHSKDFNFSFSGLKTAVLYTIRDLKNAGKKLNKSEIALEFENAAVEVLVHKTKKALEKSGAKTIIVAGGVSANKHLKKEIKKKIKDAEIIFPDKKLATDNSVMIGVVGYMHYANKKKKFSPKASIKAVGNLKLK